MFAKLLTMLLALGLMAGLLLVNRQRMYETVGERIRLHGEVERLKRRMQELKVRVAEATEPAEINAMISENQEDWKAIRLTQKRVTMADANDRDMTGQ
jgi:cell division protein FtsL